MTTNDKEPTLEEQIAHQQRRVDIQDSHVADGFKGGNNIPERDMRRAILVSLKRLSQQTPAEGCSPMAEAGLSTLFNELLKYTQHADHCGDRSTYYNEPHRCGCGLDDLKDAIFSSLSLTASKGQDK